jgi:hypothetical protein
MDQVNVESFDHKGHTSIESWFLVVCIGVG